MPTASAAIAAGSAGKKKDGGRGRSREGERGDGRKRERSSEKEAQRKSPDIFIALPTSFLHPSFHSLFLGKGGEKGEMMGGLGKSLAHSQAHHLPLTPQKCRHLCKAWGQIWGSRGVVSFAQGHVGLGECVVWSRGGGGHHDGVSHLWQITRACVKDEFFFQATKGWGGGLYLVLFLEKASDSSPRRLWIKRTLDFE